MINTDTQYIDKYLSIPDLTSDIYNHSIYLSIEKIRNFFAAKNEFPSIQLIKCPRVTTVHEEFDKLCIPLNSPMRSKKYGIYINEVNLLRTHPTSELINFITGLQNDNSPQDYLLFLVSICFVKSNIDKKKSDVVHKMDIWRIKQGDPKLTSQDLHKLVQTISEEHNWKFKITPTNHPYTLNGISGELNIEHNNTYMKFFEGGELNPKIFKMSGLKNHEQYSGVGIGLALERYVMALKKIDDIRVLHTDDPLIKSQMNDLSNYIPPLGSRYFYQERYFDINTHLNIDLVEICDLIKRDFNIDINIIENVKINNEQINAYNPNIKKLSLKFIFSHIINKLSDHEIETTFYKIKELLIKNFEVNLDKDNTNPYPQNKPSIC